MSISHRGWNWILRHVPVIFQSHGCIWLCLMNKPQQKVLQLVISAASSANDPVAMRQQGLWAGCSAGLIQTPSRRLFLPDDTASVISVFTGPAGGLLIKYFFYWDVPRNRKNHICDVDFQRKMANEGLALKWDSRWERVPEALHVLQASRIREQRLRHKKLQVCLEIWWNSRGRGFLYKLFCKMSISHRWM